jgi:hypothetical protein
MYLGDYKLGARWNLNGENDKKNKFRGKITLKNFKYSEKEVYIYTTILNATQQYKVSKLAYRIWVILIANKRVIKKK